MPDRTRSPHGSVTIHDRLRREDRDSLHRRYELGELLAAQEKAGCGDGWMGRAIGLLADDELSEDTRGCGRRSG